MSFLQTVVSHTGPLPIQSSFYAKGDGVVALFVSGTAYATEASRIGIRIAIDGVEVATSTRMAGNAAGHHALVPILAQMSVSYGQHSVEVLPLEGTMSDADDYFFVTILY